MAPVRTMANRVFLGLLCVILAGGVPLLAAGSASPELSVALSNAITRLDREAAIDTESPMLVAGLIEKQYGTREDELKWALEQKLNWGEITALAYIQAATGKSFSEMSHENARRDFWTYAENAGMNCEKMTRSLDVFLKRVQRERNSLIFDRLRASRKIHALPDLGSGFGLFQEAMDFRRIDSPRVSKIHEIPGGLAKGEK